MEKLNDKSLPNSKFVSIFDLSLPFAFEAPTSRLNESKRQITDDNPVDNKAI